MLFNLRLEERQSDRVFVTVCLRPEVDAVEVQGVAVELRSRAGEPLSSRLMLPVSGSLPGPLALRTEVRAHGDIPRGARAVGIVWWQGGQLTADVPADPATALESFCRGGCVGLRQDNPDDLPRDLTQRERRALMRHFPWIEGFRPPEEEEDPRILEEPHEDLADEIASCYGLCDEDKAFLEELLGEDGFGEDDFTAHAK